MWTVIVYWNAMTPLIKAMMLLLTPSDASADKRDVKTWRPWDCHQVCQCVRVQVSRHLIICICICSLCNTPGSKTMAKNEGWHLEPIEGLECTNSIRKTASKLDEEYGDEQCWSFDLKTFATSFYLFRWANQSWQRKVNIVKTIQVTIPDDILFGVIIPHSLLVFI